MRLNLFLVKNLLFVIFLDKNIYILIFFFGPSLDVKKISFEKSLCKAKDFSISL